MPSNPAAPVRLLAAVAIRSQIEALVAQFGAAQNREVEAAFALNPDVPREIRAGRGFDLAITNPWYMDELIAEGLADGASHLPFGRVPLAIGGAVGSAGAPATDAEAIRALLLAAGSVAYTAPGTSGKTFKEVTRRIGVWEALAGRVRPMGAGEPVAAVASGAADLAVAPLTVVLATAGVAPVAVFPAELGADIAMSMILAPAARTDPGAAALHRFLADPAHDAWLASTGIRRFRFT